MAHKQPLSTADKLGIFAEQLEHHYRSQRNPKMRPYPKPGITQFHPGIRAFAQRIEDAEFKKHEAELLKQQQEQTA